MIIKGNLKIYCERCGACHSVYCNPNIQSSTAIKKTAIEKIRESNWVVTRENRCYCKKCAKELHLRNSGVNKK